MDGPREMHDTLPGRQGRQGHLRPGDGAARRPATARRRVERPLHGPRRQRRPRPRGLPLLPRRVRHPVHAVHPHHRANHRGAPAVANAGLGRAGQGSAALHAGRRPRHRSIVPPDGYGRFLIDIFEEWVRRDVGEVYVQMFDVALANWSVTRRACASTPRPAAGRWPWSTTATFTPATTSWSRRTGWETSGRRMIDWSCCRSSRSSARTSETRCRGSACECDVRFACHGGCPKDRFTTTPTANRG